jgi:hypothetical protein
LSHTLARTSVAFDDPNLVSHAGLVPVMAPAERAGLRDLAFEHVRPGGECGADPGLKVACLMAGMAAGADSLDDMGLLRHGAAGTLFGGIRAPSTLGSFLRSFTWGNVRQAEKADRESLARLAARAPMLPGADVLAFVDIDSTQKRVYGHKKQGARFGYTKIQGKSLLVRGGERAGGHGFHPAGRAVMEQVFADLSDGPLAHLPSGRFNANAAWLVTAAMAFNLLRAAEALASRALGKARGATVRAAIVAARTPRPRPPHPPPARRLAPRNRVAQPLGSRLRAARSVGLTSPNLVRTSTPPRQPAPSPGPEQDKPQNRQRQGKHAFKALTGENG